MSEWWVGRQGANPVGPVSTDTLVRGITEKKVPEDALVCRVGEQHWQHLAQVDELWELVHPEDYRTSITQKPWFADKPDSAPPELRDADAEDESTRIIGVPILQMRSIESEPNNQKPVEKAKPAAVPAAPQVAPRAKQPSNPAVGAAPARVAAPSPVVSNTAQKAGLAPAPNFSAPAGPNPTQPAFQAPRGAISPPRFGTDRIAPKPAPAAAPQPASYPEPLGLKAPAVLGASAPSAGQQPVAPAARPVVAPASPAFVPPTNRANGNVRPEPVEEPPPDSGDFPSVPLIPVRPNPVAAAAPAQPAVPPVAPKPVIPAPPELAHPPVAQPKPAADAAAFIQRYPNAPVDYDDDTVTVIAKAPVVPHSPPASPATFPGAAPQMPPSAPTPLMPMVVAKRPPVVPVPEAAPAPLPPEVDPSELFDEDFEAPPPLPVGRANAARATVPGESAAPRPAAGTPAPPSVIVTQPPPSLPNIPDDILAHAIPHIPEQTRPAMRSLRTTGMIQMSVGTLIIGALGLVVLVLFAVLLLR